MVNLSSGIGRICKDNVGGVKKVYLFPYVKYLRSQMPITDLVLTSFPSTTIYEFEANNDVNFTNDGEENEGGKFYNESLNLEFVGIYVYDEFEKFLKQDFRCIILDNNGNYRMLGAFNGLLVENLTRTSGDAKNSFKGYRFTLSGQEERPALFLNNLDDFTIESNNFLMLETGEYLLTEENKLIIIE